MGTILTRPATNHGLEGANQASDASSVSLDPISILRKVESNDYFSLPDYARLVATSQVLCHVYGNTLDKLKKSPHGQSSRLIYGAPKRLYRQTVLQVDNMNPSEFTLSPALAQYHSVKQIKASNPVIAAFL